MQLISVFFVIAFTLTACGIHSQMARDKSKALTAQSSAIILDKERMPTPLLSEFENSSPQYSVRIRGKTKRYWAELRSESWQTNLYVSLKVDVSRPYNIGLASDAGIILWDLRSQLEINADHNIDRGIHFAAKSDALKFPDGRISSITVSGNYWGNKESASHDIAKALKGITLYPNRMTPQ